MIKIEIPSSRPDIAAAIGEALMKIGGQNVTATTFAERLMDGAVYGSTTHQMIAGSGELHRVTPEVHQAVDAAVHTHQHPTQPDDSELVANYSTTLTQTHMEPALSQLSYTTAEGGTRRDMKGVAFDEAYCANAAEPFYGSGKEKGQWKAKRGLAAGVYESWYMARLVNDVADADTPPTVQTGAAFGAPVVSSLAAPAPRSAGEFMAWVAEKQTAGKLAQDVINTAYVSLGVRVQDLFPPTPENIVANNIGALYRELSAVAGA